MGWLARKIRFRRKLQGLRPKKEKRPAPCGRREASGWNVLDTQMALEHWIRINGLK